MYLVFSPQTHTFFPHNHKFKKPVKKLIILTKPPPIHKSTALINYYYLYINILNNYMKIICTQENLKSGLATARKNYFFHNTLPILNNLLLKTENGMLKISSTNLEIGNNHTNQM